MRYSGKASAAVEGRRDHEIVRPPCSVESLPGAAPLAAKVSFALAQRLETMIEQKENIRKWKKSG
jgi:hypothetical protein